MEIWIAILGILVGAISCYLLDRKRKGELEALRKEKADSETQLGDARTEISGLTGQVNVANRQIGNLTEQLGDARTEISGLTEQVNVANRQIRNLTTQLSKVSASNENALNLLHLFELSMQLTAFALYSEVSRATRLGGENKELYAKYADLHKEYKKNFFAYEKFREEVDRKAKRRLVRSGIGAVLSFIPGVGIVQILADLSELVDFVSEASEGTADFYDMLSIAEISLDLTDFLIDFVDLKSIESLQPDMSSDQDREKAKQEYQNAFKEVFTENIAQDNQESDVFDFDNFLRAMIERMQEFVELMPENERRSALNRIVGKFGRFGINFYDYHESSEARADRSLPPPKN